MSSLKAKRRELLLKRIEIKKELLRRKNRAKQQAPGGLYEFVKYFWPILEPKTKFVDGWAIRAICAHLEAVTRGDITRLLINVPPGFSKSLICNVFWPAWEMGPKGMPHLRYIAFSYAAHLTERDNAKFRDVITHKIYRDLWGDVFKATGIGVVKVSTDKTGWKFASSVSGVGTGERGDRVLCDDPHSVGQGESDVIRNKTVRWFDEAMSNRLNDMNKSAIVVIMQRVHEVDVSGFIIKKGAGYVHLCLPMEFDGRKCRTYLGRDENGRPIIWEDPRTEYYELAWPERYDDKSLAQFRNNSFLWAGQYQQMPKPRGGGLFKDDWWQFIDVPQGSPPPPMDYVVASLDSAYTKK